MLPQFLVQNDLISNPSKTGFNLDWFLAAPIVNLNFFHIEKLLNEQYHYRQLLRPWTPVSDVISSSSDLENMKKHQYGYVDQQIAYESLLIPVGALVGRVKETEEHPASDFTVAVQTLTTYYVKYNESDNSWYWAENKDSNYPAITRCNYANLQQSQEFNLNGTYPSFVLNNGMWSYTTVQNNEDWRMSLGWANTDELHPILMRSTDIVFGRVLLEVDDIMQCIANVPITLQVQWDPKTARFTYTFSFKDQNFPSNATVELY